MESKHFVSHERHIIVIQYIVLYNTLCCTIHCVAQYILCRDWGGGKDMSSPSPACVDWNSQDGSILRVRLGDHVVCLKPLSQVLAACPDFSIQTTHPTFLMTIQPHVDPTTPPPAPPPISEPTPSHPTFSFLTTPSHPEKSITPPTTSSDQPNPWLSHTDMDTNMDTDKQDIDEEDHSDCDCDYRFCYHDFLASLGEKNQGRTQSLSSETPVEAAPVAATACVEEEACSSTDTKHLGGVQSSCASDRSSVVKTSQDRTPPSSPTESRETYTSQLHQVESDSLIQQSSMDGTTQIVESMSVSAFYTQSLRQQVFVFEEIQHLQIRHSDIHAADMELLAMIPHVVCESCRISTSFQPIAKGETRKLEMVDCQCMVPEYGQHFHSLQTLHLTRCRFWYQKSSTSTIAWSEKAKPSFQTLCCDVATEATYQSMETHRAWQLTFEEVYHLKESSYTSTLPPTQLSFGLAEKPKMSYGTRVPTAHTMTVLNNVSQCLILTSNVHSVPLIHITAPVVVLYYDPLGVFVRLPPVISCHIRHLHVLKCPIQCDLHQYPFVEELTCKFPKKCSAHYLSKLMWMFPNLKRLRIDNVSFPRAEHPHTHHYTLPLLDALYIHGASPFSDDTPMTAKTVSFDSGGITMHSFLPSSI